MKNKLLITIAALFIANLGFCSLAMDKPILAASCHKSPRKAINRVVKEKEKEKREFDKAKKERKEAREKEKEATKEKEKEKK